MKHPHLILYIKATVSVCLSVRAVPGNFFQSLPLTVITQLTGGGEGGRANTGGGGQHEGASKGGGGQHGGASRGGGGGGQHRLGGGTGEEGSGGVGGTAGGSLTGALCTRFTLVNINHTKRWISGGWLLGD
jgi:hypothetical protein